MAQAQDLNISPYYDDFDPRNNFYRVLFKPGLPVQARELTNLQSILQNQVQTFGTHVFKEGSIVIPGAPTFDNDFNSVKLNATQFGIDISIYTDKLVGKILKGQSSGVTASVDMVALPDGNNVEDITLYVKYLNSGSNDPNLYTFLDGEVLLAQENITYGNTTINSGSAVATLISSNATSVGSAAAVAEGVYFIRGTFVNVQSQRIILDHYTNNPSYQVGLKVDEQIISAKDDPSLYDNAQGFTNYAAPGADRLKITLTLTKRLLDDTTDPDFFEILRVDDGNIKKIVTKTDYNIIKDWIAERTFEESGNYALQPFSISVDNSLNNRLGNGGIFFSGERTDQGNIPSPDLMCVKISGGEAYVKGYDVTTDSLTILDTDKPRDTEKVETANIDYQMGDRIVLNNLVGQPQYRKIINFYDQLSSSVNAIKGDATLIGQARLYSLNPKDSAYSAAKSQWNAYVYDVQLYTKLVLNDNVTTAELPQSGVIRGLNSGAIGYANAAGSGTTVMLSQVSGRFIVGEQISINGINYSRSIVQVTTYGDEDIKAVKQTKDSSSYWQDFVADVSLSLKVLPGIVDITTGSSSADITSPQGPFNGIKVGDIIAYPDNNSNIVYNRVTFVAANLLSLTVEALGQSVVDVYDGSLQGNQTIYTNFRVAVGNIWSRGNNSPLYEVLPQPNIASVDLSSSNLIVSGQLTNQSISGAAATVSVNDLSGGGGVAISTAFFESYGVSRYSIFYGDGSNDGIGTVTSDSFTLVGEGQEASFTGLTDDNKSVVTVTAKKNGIQSKIKNYERSKILNVTLSRLRQSGSNENNTLNDGLTANTVAYGLRVQDEEISLNVPDVVRVLAIYESLDNSQPTFDVISFNPIATVATNAIIGENIVGQSSNAIARVVTNNNSNPSSGGINKLGIVYLNDKVFSNFETVVFEESNITTTIEGINESDTDAQYRNITKSYTLDKGQRNQYYDYSRIVRKKSSSIPSKRLLIVYDHYTIPANDSGDVFTVLSYGKERYSQDIPLLGDSQIRATDTLDFRPRVTTFSGTAKSPFDFTSRTNTFNTLPKFLLSPNGSTLLGYEFYLGRIDKIYLNEYGVLSIQKGQSAKNPQPPQNINESMELATIKLPPYLYNPKNAQIRLTDNRRYTMRDIGLLEDRIENLEDMTTLSLLEVSTEALSIRDANGRDRFKSGFFVDSFIDNSSVNYDYSAIDIDTRNREMRPIVASNTLQSQLLPATNTVDSELDFGFDYELLDPRVQKTGNIVTLKYDEVDWLEQAYATSVRNVNEFHVISYKGVVTLSPASDSWIRTIRLDELVETINQNVRVEIVNGTRRELEEGEEGGTFTGNRWNTNTTTNTQTQVRSNDVIINSGEEGWMRSRNTQFIANDLKARTRYYQFFDGNSDVDFVPKLLEIATDTSLATYGSTGTFEVGETVRGYVDGEEVISFRVATANHKSGPFNNPTTVYGDNPYVDEEMLQADYTNSSPILNVDTLALASENQGLYSGYVTIGTRLVGESSNAIAYVKDLILKTDSYGNVIGTFFLKDPWQDPAPAVRIETGNKIYRITSSSVNKAPAKGGTLISAAQAQYESRGTFVTRQVQTTNIITVTTTTRAEREQDDPLAQSFTVGGNVEAPDPNVGLEDDQHGVFVTAVDLFFQSRDEDDNGVPGNSSVTVEIRTLELGTPTRRVVGTPVVVPSSDILISDAADVATKVTFPQPIYLPPGREYAVVLLAPTSDKYQVHVAIMDEEAVNIATLPNVAAKKYTTQWALGSLFLSQNGSIWTAQQREDLKFKLYKAKFTENAGTAFFANPTLSESNGYVSNLASNAITTLPKKGQIGITTLATGNTGINTLTDTTRKIVGYTNDGSNAYVIGGGGPVSGASQISAAGTSYNATTGVVRTFNIIGSGVNYELNNITVSDGVITGFQTSRVGTGYTGGDVVGIVTADMDGNVGNGALISITNTGGLDTLYLSGIQGTGSAGGGGFIKNQNIRYYDDAGALKDLIGGLWEGLQVDAAPYDGNYIKVNQFEHGMNATNNKLELKNIKSNLNTTTLSSNLVATDSTISVGSTLAPDLNKFEGIAVGAANTGYIRIGDEIIGYESVGTGVLETITRGVDSTQSINHDVTTPVQKYELSNVSLRRINREHPISPLNIALDSYYVGFAASVGKNRSTDDNTNNIPALAFGGTEDVFCGGSNATATRNIQFDAIVPNYSVITPAAVTGATASVRTVTGTSIDGNEVSFIDQGFQPVQLNTLNNFTTPRLVCSKVNETTYLTNMERNKSFTTAINLTTTNENVSPIIQTDISYTEFRSNRLNNPITNYPDSNLVSSGTYDPNSAIYVSRTVSLDKPADSLKVLFSAFRSASSDIRVLYNLVRAGSNQSNPTFELFPGYDNLTDSTGDGFGDRVIDSAENNGRPDAFVPASVDNQFLEYQFSVDNLGEFVGYSIKIILSGTNQASAPRIRDLRTIAIK